MKTIARVLGTVLLAIACSGLIAQTNASKTAIESIYNSPASYQDELVKVEGLVTQYIPASANSSAYYLLKGDYGSFIRVNTTSNPPETNQKYCVTGVVYVYLNDQGGISKFFISEQSRYDGVCNDLPEIAVSPVTLEFGSVDANNSIEKTFTISNTGRADLTLNEISISNNENFEIIKPQTMLIQPGRSIDLKVIFTPKESGDFTGILSISSNSSNTLDNIGVRGNCNAETNWLMYILFAASALLLILLIILFTTRGNKPKQTSLSPQKPEPFRAVPDAPSYTNQPSYHTVAVPQTIHLTQKLFPGEFEIITGLDTGKKFRIPGFQGQEGLMVTIGREIPGNEMSHYHIQLKDNTVGREQAKLINNGVITELLSLGKTNFSVVDGKELKPGEKAVLNPGTVIKLGEVSLKYNL